MTTPKSHRQESICGLAATALHAASYTGIALATLLFGACSVLTKSQVAEVTKFAKVADNYTALPGAVIKADADIRETTVLLDATYTSPGQGWDAIVRASAESEEAYHDAERADKALTILKTYGDLLAVLVSNKPTDDLGNSSESLGKSLNIAIASYNTAYGTSLTSIGSWVGAAIRGAGGIYIRHRQEKILRATIMEADPVITRLNRDVANLTNKVSGQIRDQTDQLSKVYNGAEQNLPENTGMPYATIVGVQGAYKRAHRALELAPLCRKAASDYAAAHSKLRAMVSRKETVSDRIEELESLKAEIEAANKLRLSIEKNA